MSVHMEAVKGNLLKCMIFLSGTNFIDLNQGGYVFTPVCLCVSWFVALQDYTRSDGWINTELGVRMQEASGGTFHILVRIQESYFTFFDIAK